MRGGMLHNALVVRLLDLMDTCGLEVRSEVPVYDRRGVLVGFGDIVARGASELLLVELENSTKQLACDISKALAMAASSLWIVVPNPKVGRSFKSRLGKLPDKSGFQIRVLTYPQAMAQILGKYSGINN